MSELLMPPITRCPICNSEYYNLKASEDVCVYHQKYLVTKCELCGKTGYSDSAGLCMNCCPPTRRYSLRDGVRERAYELEEVGADKLKPCA